MNFRALAIETSGRIGSIALCEEGRVICEETFPHGLKHAAEILPLIDRLMRQRSWQPRDARELYVSAGPGSFTGLRIGVTLAKTLSLVTGARIVAVPSVEVLLKNAPAEARHVLIVLDAKREQIFTARFDRSEEGTWGTGEAARLDSLTAMLERAGRPVWLIGEGIPFHEKFLPPDAAARGIYVTDPACWRARAGAAAECGMKLARMGVFTDSLSLTPIYIRRPEAEEKLEQKSSKGGTAG